MKTYPCCDNDGCSLCRGSGVYEPTTPVYRLARRGHPYVPQFEGYGPGCAVQWPNFSPLAVGYRQVPESPGNLYIPNPDKNGCPDGGAWEILNTWQTGWMCIRSIITGETIFSVPPGTLELLDLADETPF